MYKIFFSLSENIVILIYFSLQVFSLKYHIGTVLISHKILPFSFFFLDHSGNRGTSGRILENFRVQQKLDSKISKM